MSYSQSGNEQTTQKIRETARKTEDTLSNVEKVLRETQGTANDVTEELYNQGEALKKVDGTLDNIHDETEYSKKLAKQVNKGFFGWLFTSEPKQPKPVHKTPAAEPAPRARPAQPTPAATSSSQNVSASRLDTDALRKTGNDELAKELEAHDDRYNQQLDTIGGLLDGLAFQAEEIGKTLDEQNESLMNAETKTTDVHGRVQDAHSTLKKFTK